ncbi:MAG TPA: putative sulfate/molybdate transporter [Thermoanaerobaculia bacterium]|nr:putative sulfate/molybdate transporter [Thermoanaerobaculia bacterium]
MSAIRFDRNELAGSFGDVGTDLPLIFGMILAARLDAASVLIVFGFCQVLTGVVYRLPMPMQPLKAMAVLVIAGGVSSGELFGGGLAIGLVMLALSLTGGLEWLAARIPLAVVRGIQLGLGLSLARLALERYVPSQGAAGWALAGAGFAVLLVLWGNRRVPGGLVVIGLGLVYALVFRADLGALAEGAGLALPELRRPTAAEIWTGFLVLALPQLPLSLSNSVIATAQTVRDLFPGRRVGVRRIGFTYSAVNLAAPFLGGIPVCHGSGGLAGHYALGARTGGSVILYGSMLAAFGLFLSGSVTQIVEIFPLPILGVVLLVESLTLMRLVGDVAGDRRGLAIALLVAVVALTLPQGYLIGLALGVALHYLPVRYGREAVSE